MLVDGLIGVNEIWYKLNRNFGDMLVLYELSF